MRARARASHRFDEQETPMTVPAPERAEERSRGQRARKVTVQIGVPLFAAMIGLYGLLALLGTLLVHGRVPPAVNRWDSGASDWAYEHRTPTLDRLTQFGPLLAESVTAIAIAVVAVIVFRVWLGRWREAVVVAAAVLGELMIFLAITATVHRPRPPVPHLDPA